MKRLRPVDLARLAGISTQQIRNYVDAGVLPPAPRDPSGYRIFGERHRHALLAYRALAQGHGWEPARSIMRAVHSGDLPAALMLIDAGHAALHEERFSLRAAGAALEGVASSEPPLRSAGLRIGEAAGLLGVRASTLRVWEAAGLLAPSRERTTGYRTFSRADVRDARMIKLLRQEGYPLSTIQDVLDGLRRTGSSDALRAAIAHRLAGLTARGKAMLEGAGHLRAYIAYMEEAK